MKKEIWWIVAILFLLLLLWRGKKVIEGSRAYRNKNPGNLRPLPHGQLWHGQTGVDPDGYIIFGSFVDGFRAMARDLHTKIFLHGWNTIEKIIPVWAPREDHNDPEAYISSVEKITGIPRDKALSSGDIFALVPAMARVEMGLEWFSLVPGDVIGKGVSEGVS